jgi:hypothetical protein
MDQRQGGKMDKIKLVFLAGSVGVLVGSAISLIILGRDESDHSRSRTQRPPVAAPDSVKKVNLAISYPYGGSGQSLVVNWNDFLHKDALDWNQSEFSGSVLIDRETVALLRSIWKNIHVNEYENNIIFLNSLIDHESIDVSIADKVEGSKHFKICLPRQTTRVGVITKSYLHLEGDAKYLKDSEEEYLQRFVDNETSIMIFSHLLRSLALRTLQIPPRGSVLEF